MVSVVILTTGEAKSVLRDLKNQTHRNFEIILAKERGIVKAMNSALWQAKGDILVRIDDDVTLPKNWLVELVKPFSDPQVAGATGPTFVPKDRRQNRDSIRIAEDPNWFLRWMFDNEPYALAKIYKCGSVSYGSNFPEVIRRLGIFEPDHLEGTNWAMRTSLIKMVGGFDPAFDGVAEWFDTDVEQKIKRLGYKLRYNPEAYLFHMLEKTENYYDRFEVFGRIENWLRFHKRHSKFHYKKIIWLLMLLGYAVCPKSR